MNIDQNGRTTAKVWPEMMQHDSQHDQRNNPNKILATCKWQQTCRLQNKWQSHDNKGDGWKIQDKRSQQYKQKREHIRK
jgi:hypothetical protein